MGGEGRPGRMAEMSRRSHGRVGTVLVSWDGPEAQEGVRLHRALTASVGVRGLNTHAFVQSP